MKKIIISLLFLLFFANGALAGVNDAPTTAQKFKSGEVIKSASELSYPPFSVVAADGRADGFSVELLRETLKVMNLNVSFKVDEWNVIKQELADGKLQVLPLVGRTPERETIYDFTFPYLTLHGSIFVRKDDNRIKSLSDLSGKEVIVMKGDNAEEYVRRVGVTDKIIDVSTYEEAMKLLSEGKYDAVVAQEVMGLMLLRDLGIKNVIPVGSKLDQFRQDFSFAVRDGDGELLEVLNEGLAIVNANGTFDKLYKKWFGSVVNQELTPLDFLKRHSTALASIASIFFLGMFFLLRAEVKRKTKALSNEIEINNKNQRELEDKQRKLIFMNKNLLKKEEEIEKKNKELEETLDSFYTMRLGMQQDMEKGVLEEENNKIKAKLDKIRKTK